MGFVNYLPDIEPNTCMIVLATSAPDSLRCEDCPSGPLDSRALIAASAVLLPCCLALMNAIPGRVGDPFPELVDDIKTTWRDWISRSWFDWEIGGYPYWSHLSHALTFWNHRHQPNIMMLHFNDLLADLDGEMRRLADFLEIEVPDAQWTSVVERCTFKEVKKDPSKVVGDMDFGFKGGADTFIHKGTNGRWLGVLDDSDLALYEQAMSKLPPDYATWLETGRLGT